VVIRCTISRKVKQALKLKKIRRESI
jgi:hypothetical protein